MVSIGYPLSRLAEPSIHAASILLRSRASPLFNGIRSACGLKQFRRWNTSNNQNDSKELVVRKPREIFEQEFPEYFSEGKFVTRISYVDFIDQARERMKELGLEKNLEAYKELLRIFPPGKYAKKSAWDIGLFHAPQQLCAVRLLFQMEINQVKPDSEIEKIIIGAFSKSSQVWLKIARSIYWSMKARNIDPYPLLENLDERPHELAKAALVRMLDDHSSIISVRRTANLPDVIDKTWVVYSQSPTQQSIIEKLDEKKILYIEESGMTYVRDKYLSYFSLKVYDDEETIKRRNQKPEPDFNYNTVKMKFYGKPIREKIQELEDIHHFEDHQLLALGITGTSSHDSVLSWLKILQERNPKLKRMNVLFKLQRPTYEIQRSPDDQREHRSASN